MERQLTESIQNPLSLLCHRQRIEILYFKLLLFSHRLFIVFNVLKYLNRWEN